MLRSIACFRRSHFGSASLSSPLLADIRLVEYMVTNTVHHVVLRTVAAMREALTGLRTQPLWETSLTLDERTGRVIVSPGRAHFLDALEKQISEFMVAAVQVGEQRRGEEGRGQGESGEENAWERVSRPC